MDTQVKENTGILFQVTKEAVKEYHRQEDETRIFISQYSITTPSTSRLCSLV
jgi:hypothetical protein